MRLSFSRTKNACSYYIIDSYRDLDGKVKTKVIEKLGTEKYIKETAVAATVRITKRKNDDDK